MRRRAAARGGARRNGRAPAPPVPGVEGLAVATGVWLCALAAVAWVLNPYAAGLLVLAAHLWLFAAGGWRGLAGARRASRSGSSPVLAVAVHYGLALDLGPLELAWGAALAAAAGAGLWSTLLLAGVLAALAGVVRVLFARRRIARDGGRRGRADPHARAAQLRRPGLARRHRVGAAAMTTATRQPRAARAAARALDGADRLRDAAAGRRRRDAAVAGAGVRRLLALPAGRARGRAGHARPAAADAGRAARARAACPTRSRRLAFAARSLDRRTDDGDPVGRLRIDRIGLSSVVVEGTDAGDLRTGPGHYPGTPLPGQRGTVAIAGHRTTYGAPFRKIDKVRPRDEIVVTMPYGRFTYRVERTRIVPPTAVWVTQRVSATTD